MKTTTTNKKSKRVKPKNNTKSLSMSDVKSMKTDSSGKDIGVRSDKKFKIEVMSHFPGPFDQKTSIVYKLDHPSCVSLVVYGSASTGVTYLACGFKREGYHKVDFDASNLPSGVYIARLRTDTGVIKEFMTKLGSTQSNKPD